MRIQKEQIERAGYKESVDSGYSWKPKALARRNLWEADHTAPLGPPTVQANDAGDVRAAGRVNEREPRAAVGYFGRRNGRGEIKSSRTSCRNGLLTWPCR